MTINKRLETRSIVGEKSIAFNLNLTFPCPTEVSIAKNNIVFFPKTSREDEFTRLMFSVSVN